MLNSSSIIQNTTTTGLSNNHRRLSVQTFSESRSGPTTAKMAMTPSIGDILMLSQTAWRIGRAFTQGKKSAPAEFAEVEREADGLSEALQLVAETLNADGSILDKAEDATKSAVTTILDSAQRTLSDLESFVARYRIIKPQTGERAWSELVLANYKTLKWTTEGGDITALRDMLNMHTSTINLTMQALQSRSLARLERVVMPMAESVASIHDRVHKIDDLHRIIMAIVNGTPALTGQVMHERMNSTASDGTVSTYASISNGTHLADSPNLPINSYILDRPINRQVSRDSNQSHSTEYAHQWRMNSACYGNSNARDTGLAIDNGIDWDFESGAPPTSELDIGDRFAGSSATVLPTRSSSLARISGSHHTPNTPRRESMTLPNLLASTAEEDTREGGSRPMSNQLKRRVDSKMSDHELPPPAMSPDITANRTQTPATPASMFSASPSMKGRRFTNGDVTYSPRSAVESIISEHTSKRSSVASSSLSVRRNQQSSPPGAPAFEKALFRNAAILCDVRCTLVEFAQHDPDAEDPRYDTEMVPLCHEARVCVIRKRENRENGGTRIVAAIWTISDDGEVRCQQKLPDITETVPYCSFFEPEKVAIPPTTGEILLRFHAQNWGDPEQKDVRTKWINYVFENEKSATEFQSAVFGRQLLGSFRTTKTTVLHEGFKGAFAFEEQFANIEVLRLWEDDGVNTPGGSGGVMALLHMSSSFGQGWAKWWMNSSRQQVRVKDEQNKFAKLKGIDIRVLRPVEVRSSTANGVRSSSTFSDSASLRALDAKVKKGPERNVTGVRIEFKTEEERARFVETVKRVQERVLPLPDI
jgi:hypothetical protein